MYCKSKQICKSVIRMISYLAKALTYNFISDVLMIKLAFFLILNIYSSYCYSQSSNQTPLSSPIYAIFEMDLHTMYNLYFVSCEIGIIDS